MKHGVALAAAALVLMVGACGQDSDSSTKPDGTGSTTAAPSTTGGAEWTPKEAGEKYLEMVKPANAANNELGRVSSKTDRTVPEMTAQCRKVADAEYVLIDALAKGSWPEAARADIAKLIDATKKDAAGNEKCAVATTVAAVQEGFLESRAANVKGAAEAVRVALEVPHS